MVAWYLFQRYALPITRQTIAADQLLQSSLKKRLEGTKKQEHNLMLAREHQHALYYELSVKIEQWRAAVDKQRQELLEQQSLIEKNLQIRHRQHIEYQRQAMLKNKAVPRALDEAQDELQSTCTSPDVMHKYTESIIAYMRKVSL